MKTFIFGFDSEHPSECARSLREHNIEAVVMGAPTPAIEAALEKEGIELYLSCGAYRVTAESNALAVDSHGLPQRWFNSGCPNDHDNADRLMQTVLERARTFSTVSGILVDGARFASFASLEGIDPFFTCFCPRCMQAMKELGLDAEGIHHAVRRLANERRVSPEIKEPLQSWLDFREHTIGQYMDAFAAQVHAVRSGMLAGAFIFAPSLGRFVGQTAQACRALDMVSHMLYRAYPHEDGVACLGHEWAALAAAFGSESSAFQQLGNTPFTVERPASDLLAKGFEPAWIGAEIAVARRDFHPRQQLWPIIQIEDERIVETARQAFENGADRVGYFAYGQAPLPSNIAY